VNADDARLREFRLLAAQRQAQDYLSFYGPVTSHFLDAVARATLPVPPNGLALDLGCGDGALATRLQRQGWRCVAADLSPAMCAIAGGRIGPGRTVTADASALPFGDGTVDAVTGAFLLPHLGSLGEALAELRRVLRRDGRLVLTNWAACARSPFTGLLSEILSTLAPSGAGAVLADLERRTVPGHLRDTLYAAGFHEILVEEHRDTVEQPSPSAWWDGILKGSYGMQRLLRLQSAELRAAAKTEFTARAAAFGPPGGPLSVPVAALVVSAGAR
jgi:ubiquinone/menaquinone biosynthesis C-methylase UbiE